MGNGVGASLSAGRGQVARLAVALAALAPLCGAAVALAVVQQGEKLVPSGASGAAEAGYSVAISADGNAAVVGAPHDSGSAGAAWVYTRSGGTWVQAAKLTPAAGEEVGKGEFGDSVALSADGTTALIGAAEDGSATGAAWAFTNGPGGWTQQMGKLTGAGEMGKAAFGNGVALSADGDTALVSGPEDNSTQGAVWVYTRAGGSWTAGPKLVSESSETVNGEFGWSVALSADGNTALMGGTGDNSSKGAAWVFTRSGAAWGQQGSKLEGSGEAGAGELGYSAALSADGNTALLGGPFDNSGRGAAWVFTRGGTTWTQAGEKLTPGDESGGSRFGWSAALAADASTALIGGPSDQKGPGAAWRFGDEFAHWSQLGAKILPATATEALGEGVALAGDGETALIGAPHDGLVGAAFAFVEPPREPGTGPATGVNVHWATLTGLDGGGPSHVSYFQYGPSSAYGSTTPAQTFPSHPLIAITSVAPGTFPDTAMIVGLDEGTVYHFRFVSEDSGGTSFGPDRTFTTPVHPGVLCSCKLGGLHIGNARESHKRWREGARAARYSRRGVPVGTTFSFTLDQGAKVGFAFTQSVAWRSVHGHCVAKGHGNRHRPRCTRLVTRATLMFGGHAGVNKLSFAGLIHRGKRLAPGAYTLRLRAALGGLTSNTVLLRFTIVP